MKRYIVHRLLQGVVPAFPGGDDRVLPGQAHRQSGRPDAAGGSPPEDRVAMTQTLGLDGSLLHQFLIFVGNALHGDLGMSIRMSEPTVDAFFSTSAEHAGDHSVGDPVRGGGGHPARCGGGAQSRQHRGPCGRRCRRAGHRDAELLAWRGADIRVQRAVGLAAIGAHGRAGPLRPAGDHTRQFPHRRLHAADAVEHAGRDGQRVRQAGAYQGAERRRW